MLVVTARDDMIVLKKISSKISTKDMKVLRLVEEAWKDIEKGNYNGSSMKIKRKNSRIT